ncbi:hypothetical protein AVT14_gp62 [Mycobacterium phage Abrogate]|uniref:hypothetical protein n=1 Tax=Mycobacterium phage Abrogate TaxID=1551710 RepID=UPI00051A93C5|nr:hypothetical protein AVT14_gp62 [Mycobacterium phage Abrogate]AIT13206.1 hypothetical protein PBI_ABROGATE_620 [Mycobacterium phage Abrogate]
MLWSLSGNCGWWIRLHMRRQPPMPKVRRHRRGGFLMPDNLTRNELLEAIIEEYPWFPEYPVDWDRYSTYLFLLGRAHPNMVCYIDEETS